MLLQDLHEATKTIESLVSGNPWLAAYKAAGKALYRGARLKGQPVATKDLGDGITAALFKFPVRKDRRGLNTSSSTHKLLDKWFDEKFGYKARSQSIFATGDVEDAASYGDEYQNGAAGIVIPIGGDVIWSPKIVDLYFGFNGDDTDGEILSKLETYEYELGNLEGLLSSNRSREAMIVGADEYYFLTVVEDGWEEETNLDEDQYKKYLKKLLKEL